MLTNPSRILLILTLTLGIYMAVSSSSWFLMWIGLELNLLSFVPLMIMKNNSHTTESALKYFMIQALGSAILLMSFSTNHTTQLSTMHELMALSFILKMGAAPLHFWLPSIMEGLDWWKCFYLMTIQKVAPVFLLSHTIAHLPWTPAHKMILASSAISSLIGSLGGLNQTLLRKMMAYSSINHLAWMLMSILVEDLLWSFYLLVYSIIAMSLIIIFHLEQWFHLSQISIFASNSPKLKMSLFMSLMSLGGLPPFTGFIPKWFVINAMMNSSHLSWLPFLLLGALITLFYYLRITLSIMMLKTPKPLLKTPQTKKSYYLPSLLIINMSPAIFLPLIHILS